MFMQGPNLVSAEEAETHAPDWDAAVTTAAATADAASPHFTGFLSCQRTHGLVSNRQCGIGLLSLCYRIFRY